MHIDKVKTHKLHRYNIKTHTTVSNIPDTFHQYENKRKIKINNIK